jgi:IstB-like ATP binding protein
MLTHPTLDKLHALRLQGMAQAFEEQLRTPGIEDLSAEERLGLLIDREIAWRETRRLATRLRNAKLRQGASIEDIDYRYPRGLDKPLLMKLASSQWLREHHNVLITGPTGIGKSWIACALAQKAWPARASACSMCAPHAGCKISLSLKAMAATASSSLSLPAPTSSCSMTSLPPPLPRRADATSLNFSRTATRCAPRSSPASFPSSTGMRPSATLRSPMLSSIASCTTPTSST